MKWKKLGLIYCPEDVHPWMLSHAANTVAVNIGDDRFRIYFSTRNINRQASIGFVEVSMKNPTQILRVSEKPVLSPGEIGLFDDSGVSLSCIIPVENKLYMYYLGWNLGVTVPWRNSIGLAVSDDGGETFQRTSKAPLLDRNHIDPYSISYPFVFKDDEMYHMYYGSNLSWGAKQEEMAHLIKYAWSEDGRQFHRTGDIALNFKNEKEYAISRPFVFKDGDVYKMWYSYRGASYRIGYAESTDGIRFNRMDEKVGIDVSEQGWDSEMICYPFLFDHKGNRYMLYNGNGYGKTGFGLAVLDR
jgi:predicted GH43/DUF377 family glycosyl hydrolase